MVYNKLVRDKIPEIIKSSRLEPVTRVLSDDEYEVELEKKLQEEVLEYLNSDGNMEEVADILEVLFAIIKNRGYTFDDVMQLRNQKLNARGGFEDKIFLIESKEVD